MIIMEKHARFVPNAQLCLAAVFAMGILVTLCLCIAAFALLVYVLTIAFQAVCELGGALTALYTQADSLGKIILWLFVTFLLLKLSPFVLRSVRASLHKLVDASGPTAGK